MLNDVLTIKRLVSRALDEVYSHDLYLIANKVHERSIVFRFSHYLQNLMNSAHELSTYNLDVEYNRNQRQPKRIRNRQRGAYPDVIVHQRGSNTSNLLMIEFKTHWDTTTDDDLEKLKEFTKDDGVYHFPLGLSVVFGELRDEVIIKEVAHGEVLDV